MVYPGDKQAVHIYKLMLIYFNVGATSRAGKKDLPPGNASDNIPKSLELLEQRLKATSHKMRPRKEIATSARQGPRLLKD
jgi:hypothetical protein